MYAVLPNSIGVEMSHQPERALTQALIVHHYQLRIAVEMSHQPERALTPCKENSSLITAVM